MEALRHPTCTNPGQQLGAAGAPSAAAGVRTQGPSPAIASMSRGGGTGMPTEQKDLQNLVGKEDLQCHQLHLP